MPWDYVVDPAPLHARSRQLHITIRRRSAQVRHQIRSRGEVVEMRAGWDGRGTYDEVHAGDGEGERDGDGGDGVVAALEVRRPVDALEVPLLLQDLLPRSERWLRLRRRRRQRRHSFPLSLEESQQQCKLRTRDRRSPTRVVGQRQAKAPRRGSAELDYLLVLAELATLIDDRVLDKKPPEALKGHVCFPS